MEKLEQGASLQHSLARAVFHTEFRRVGYQVGRLIVWRRDKNLYKSCILLVKINSPLEIREFTLPGPDPF